MTKNKLPNNEQDILDYIKTQSVIRPEEYVTYKPGGFDNIDLNHIHKVFSDMNSFLLSETGYKKFDYSSGDYDLVWVLNNVVDVPIVNRIQVGMFDCWENNYLNILVDYFCLPYDVIRFIFNAGKLNLGFWFDKNSSQLEENLSAAYPAIFHKTEINSEFEQHVISIMLNNRFKADNTELSVLLDFVIYCLDDNCFNDFNKMNQLILKNLRELESEQIKKAVRKYQKIFGEDDTTAQSDNRFLKIMRPFANRMIQ